MADQISSLIAQRAVAFAKTKLGDPYVLGGTGPHTYDCSGLTQDSYTHAGLEPTLPRTSEMQWAAPYQKVLWGQWAVGDLIFSNFPGEISPGHVCMYTGSGNCIEAPKTGDVVKIVPVEIFKPYYVGSNRPAPYVPPPPKVWDIANGKGQHLTSTKHPRTWLNTHRALERWEEVVVRRRK